MERIKRDFFSLAWLVVLKSHSLSTPAQSTGLDQCCLGQSGNTAFVLLSKKDPGGGISLWSRGRFVLLLWSRGQVITMLTMYWWAILRVRWNCFVIGSAALFNSNQAGCSNSLNGLSAVSDRFIRTLLLCSLNKSQKLPGLSGCDL